MDKVPFDIQIFHIAQTDSTNEEAKRRWTLSLRHEPNGGRRRILCVRADYQTAGRGQKGARWEAEWGKNLLFSVLVEPRNIPVERAFVLSQAMALAVRDAVTACIEGQACEMGLPQGIARRASIKWPNDVYYGERKMSGTIIETTVQGREVSRCVIGVGVNVNQRVFRSDAPNPVSLCSVLGCDVEIEGLLREVLSGFQNNLMLAEQGGGEIGERYVEHLMRREGLHCYRDAQGVFEAEFVGVEHDGHLLLRDTAGRLRRYYFKEVRHVFREMETE